MSDDSGSYTAAGLDPGVYVVQVTKAGFTGNNKSVTSTRTTASRSRSRFTAAAAAGRPAHRTGHRAQLAGLNQAVVRSTLTAVGLKEEFTGNPNLGPARFQNYRAGAKVKPGTTVAVYFPETPPPPPQVRHTTSAKLVRTVPNT